MLGLSLSLCPRLISGPCTLVESQCKYCGVTYHKSENCVFARFLGFDPAAAHGGGEHAEGRAEAEELELVDGTVMLTPAARVARFRAMSRALSDLCSGKSLFAEAFARRSKVWPVRKQAPGVA